MRRFEQIRSDERGIILGWFAKLALGFVLVGLVIFDGGSILVNFFTLDSTADEIAIELTTDAGSGALTLTELEPRARTLAAEAGARLVSVSIDNNIVYITLRRRAKTLIVGRIGPIKDWARATADGQAGTG